MKELAQFAQKGSDTRYARYAWVLESMTDEILDDLMPDDPEMIGSWFEQFGHLIEWCGSGDDSVLPESMRPYLARKQRELLAITAGDVD